MDIAELLLRITGDSDSAERAITGVKDRLAELHDKRATVSVDVDQAAKAKLDALQAKLRSLKDEQIKVGVNDAATKAKIDAVQAEIDRLHGKTVEVKVKADTSQAGSALDMLKTKWGAIGTAALVAGPQMLGFLGQATLGAGALTVATGGAAASFGILGKAVQDTLSGQANQYQSLKQIATAQTQLNRLQSAGGLASVKLMTAQNALVAAEKSGNVTRIQIAQQHLAIVQSSTQAQLQGNQQLIQAAKQHLAALQADYNAQNQLAQKVNTSISGLKNNIESALAPAVQQVLHGMLPLLSTLNGAIGGLAGPFKALGTAVRDALANPQTQAGIKALIDGFGQVVKASAPLAGPLIKGLIDVGKILLNIAKDAMPVLVSLMRELVGWLDKVARTSGTAAFAAEIKKWADGFVTLLLDVIALWKALQPLFASAALFQPLLAAVIALISVFTHLLASLGIVGRLLAGGLGLALIATRFAALRIVLGLLSAAFIRLAVAAIGPLLTMFPGLVTAFWALDAAIGGGVAALGAAVIAAAPFIAIALAIVAVIALVIKYHKQLWEAVKWVWEAIKTVVSTVVAVLVTIVKKGFGLIVSAITGALKLAAAAVSKGWDLIKSLISKALSLIGGIVSKGWKLVEGLFVKAWDVIKGVVSKGIGLVVNLVKTLPGKIVSALGDIVGFFFNIGKNIIEGLIKGIESMFGAVGSVISSLVGNITGAIGGLLGLHSPSKVAHGWGQMVGQGLVDGMHSTLPLVAAAAKRLVGAVTGAPSMGFTLGLAGGAGTQTAASPAMTAIKLLTRELARLIKAVDNLAAQLAKAASGTLSSTGLSAASITTASVGPQLAGPPMLQPQSGGALYGQPVGPVIYVQSKSLVPATPAEQKRIADVVTEAIRRSTPGTVKR